MIENQTVDRLVHVVLGMLYGVLLLLALMTLKSFKDKIDRMYKRGYI